MDLKEFGVGLPFEEPPPPAVVDEYVEGDTDDILAIIRRNLEQPDLDALVARKVAHVPQPWEDDKWASDEWVDNEKWHATYAPLSEPLVREMSTVKALPVEWLWEHRIPQGALTVIDGDPGIGKSTITIDLAARLTRGVAMPDGTRSPVGPAAVLLVGAEDALGYTVRPRLEAAGADLSLVSALTGVADHENPSGRPLSLPEDTAILERAILNRGAKLVIIDPIMAYLSSEINSSSDQEVRRVLTPLAKIAEDTGATILMVRHLRKTNDGPALYQGGGSIGIVGAARAGLIVVRDPQDESMCILKQSKTNLGPWPRPIGYFLTGAGRDAAAQVKWCP